jgi:hypothetical protein
VLLGRVVASLIGVHSSGRTGIMLGTGVVLALISIVTSAKRHLPRG